MDYWALGHVHNRRLINETPVILYPGIIQGRNIREQGERGCYLVEVDQDFGIRTCFQTLDVMRWIHKTLSIAGLETEQDLLDALEGMLQEISGSESGCPAIIRITLVGSGRLYGQLNRPHTISHLEEALMDWGVALWPPVWIDRIQLRIRPEMDVEAIIGEDGFIGEILRVARDLEAQEDLRAFFKGELKSLFQSPKFRRFLDDPDSNTIREWLEKAQGICLDQLMDGE
jgi:hypothetical protein